MIMELDYQIQHESTAATAMPQSWSEREALRRFEEVRSMLRDRLENILSLHPNDVVKARMAFEQEAREFDLDPRSECFGSHCMPCLISTSKSPNRKRCMTRWCNDGNA